VGSPERITARLASIGRAIGEFRLGGSSRQGTYGRAGERGRAVELQRKSGGRAAKHHEFACGDTASRSRVLALNLPRKALRPLLRDFDTVLAHTIPNQVGALRLLASYIEALLGEPAPPTLELRHLAVAHIYDLAALAMGATRDAAEIANNRGLRAARLRVIKSDIAANLQRDGLSVGEIAIRQRVTPRYVQMLFEDEGTTFTEFVLDARLDRAHRMLVDPRLADRSISAIAFDAGFGDLSYFNRTFRRRFGRTPSDIRAVVT
jgi:AraC-like DNA-binding protein